MRASNIRKMLVGDSDIGGTRLAWKLSASEQLRRCPEDAINERHWLLPQTQAILRQGKHGVFAALDDTQEI